MAMTASPHQHFTMKLHTVLLFVFLGVCMQANAQSAVASTATAQALAICADCPPTQLVVVPQTGSRPIGYFVTRKISRHDVKQRLPSYEPPQDSCGDDCPATDITYREILEYTQALQRTSRLAYRLPTLSEWVAICKAETHSPRCEWSATKASLFSPHTTPASRGYFDGIYEVTATCHPYHRSKKRGCEYNYVMGADMDEGQAGGHEDAVMNVQNDTTLNRSPLWGFRLVVTPGKPQASSN